MSGPDEFQNPLTGSTYRLRFEADGWRITKVVHDAGSVIVRHLRGVHVAGMGPPADAVDRLVRGEHQVSAVDADAHRTFGEAVLLDLDRVSGVLSAVAREAQQRRIDGAPGFRPGCAVLRGQERAALDRAVDGCRRMAAAWMATGMSSEIGLPAWLQAATEDAESSSSMDRRRNQDSMVQ